MNDNAKCLMRGIDVLLVIKAKGFATTAEIQKQALSEMTRRSVQRYMKNLSDAGLVYRVGEVGRESKFYLTGKSLVLFGCDKQF